MARFDNVIVGGGLAAGMVAQEYRGADGDGSVLLIGREPHPLPPAAPDEGVPARREAGRGRPTCTRWTVAELDVELRLSTEVAAIDPAAHAVELAGGDRIEYGRLALATGATPRTLGDAASIRVIEDSQRVGALLNDRIGTPGCDRRRLHRRRGGGKRPHEGTGRDAGHARAGALVTPVRRPGRRAYFQGHMERHGVRVLTGQKTLPDGDYDLILAGIGVSPNIELAQNAGLPTNHGVLADDHLVAAPDIWVAGDIAEYQSVIHGRRIRIEHWDVALNHGSYIGKSWAGAEDGPYQVVPYFFSDIGDWTWMEYVGPGNRDDPWRCAGRWTTDDFVAYYSNADGKLTACLAVNRGDELNAARELIASGGGVPLGLATAVIAGVVAFR